MCVCVKSNEKLNNNYVLTEIIKFLTRIKLTNPKTWIPHVI